jgi:hypothetical protein
MKRHQLLTCGAFALCIIALACSTFAPTHTAAASPAFAPVTAVPLYRFYDRNHGFHFYTADPDERAVLRKDSNWSEEQQEGYCFREQVVGTTALYRVGKGGRAGGSQHFYTIDLAQVRDAEPGGWKNEGVACYVSMGQVANTAPLYRLYRPFSQADWDDLQGKLASGMFFNFDAMSLGDDQFYTIDGKQKYEATAQGYQLVRVEAYVWTQPVTFNTSSKPATPAPLPESYYTEQLFNLGCSKAAGGGITCLTKGGYFECEYYRKQGKIKANACVANFDLASFNKIEANLVDLGCKRFASRPGEYQCESWAGGDACDAAVKTSNGLITVCYTPRMFVVASYQDSFGREPTPKEIDYWAGEIKAKKLTYKDVTAANRQWLKTDAAGDERRNLVNRNFFEVFGRVASAAELNYWRDKIEKEGTSYAELRKLNLDWLLGSGGVQQLGEFVTMIQRAYSVAGLPKPTDAQIQKSVADVTAKRLTFKQLVASLKK